MFDKLKDKLKGGEVKTQYSAELNAELDSMEAWIAAMGKAEKAARTVGHRGGSGAKNWTVEEVAEALGTLGGSVLEKGMAGTCAGTAEGAKELGLAERALGDEVEKGLAGTLHDYLQGPAKDFAAAYKALKSKRKDMDSAAAKARDKPTTENKEKETRTAAEHEEALEKVKAILATVDVIRNGVHQAALLRFLKAQDTYHAAVIAAIDKAKPSYT